MEEHAFTSQERSDFLQSMTQTATFGSSNLANTFGTYKRLEANRQLQGLTKQIGGSQTLALMAYKVPPMGVLEVVQAVLVLVGVPEAEYEDWQRCTHNLKSIKQKMADVVLEQVSAKAVQVARAHLAPLDAARISNSSECAGLFYDWAMAVVNQTNGTRKAGPKSPSSRSKYAQKKSEPVLDYSFHEIKNISEISDHDGSGQRNTAEEEQDAEEKSKPKRPKSRTSGVRLSYNDISDLSGLMSALEEVMEDPRNNLQLLDLSFNKLTSIDPVLCEFPNLVSLNLQGNKITSMKEVKKLNSLSRLHILTLNGNQTEWKSADEQRSVKRLEDTKYYRQNVIYSLKDTQLRSLDNSSITPKDRQNAMIWADRIKRKPR